MHCRRERTARIVLHASSLATCLLLSGIAALGGEQGTPSALKEYRQRFWTTEHGLPHSTVRAILQTTDGYLWIGTQRGLARFDGVKFTDFTPRKLNSDQVDLPD